MAIAAARATKSDALAEREKEIRWAISSIWDYHKQSKLTEDLNEAVY